MKGTRKNNIHLIFWLQNSGIWKVILSFDHNCFSVYEWSHKLNIIPQKCYRTYLMPADDQHNFRCSLWVFSLAQPFMHMQIKWIFSRNTSLVWVFLFIVCSCLPLSYSLSQFLSRAAFAFSFSSFFSIYSHEPLRGIFNLEQHTQAKMVKQIQRDDHRKVRVLHSYAHTQSICFTAALWIFF